MPPLPFLKIIIPSATFLNRIALTVFKIW